MSLIEKIDNRYVYILIIVITVWPQVSPLGLPIIINDDTQQFFDGVEAIPEDSLVVMDWNTRFGRPTRMILMEDAFKHLMSKGVRIVHVSFDKQLEGGEVCEMVIRKVDPEQTFGYVYGTDYVNLGSVGGTEAALAGFVSDAWKIFPVDQRGGAIEDMPLMQEMRSGEDIDAVIFAGTGHTMWVGQLTQEYDVPIYAM